MTASEFCEKLKKTEEQPIIELFAIDLICLQKLFPLPDNETNWMHCFNGWMKVRYPMHLKSMNKKYDRSN